MVNKTFALNNQSKHSQSVVHACCPCFICCCSTSIHLHPNNVNKSHWKINSEHFIYLSSHPNAYWKTWKLMIKYEITYLC